MSEPNPETAESVAPEDRGDLSSLAGPALAKAVRDAGVELARACGEGGESRPSRVVGYEAFERLVAEVERRLGAPT